MAVGQIPPWIKPADEADYLGRGLQIGASMAAEQAQEEYRNNQLQLEQANQQAQQLRQAQQDQLQQQLNAQIQARLEKQFNIEAQQAAQKSQALLGYQDAIKSGQDPMQAILQFGPAMGQPVTAAAAAQRALMQAQQKPKVLEAPQVGYADFQGNRVPYLWRPGTTHFSWMPSGYADTGSGGNLSKADTAEINLLKQQAARLEAVQNKYIENNGVTKAVDTDNADTKAKAKAYQDRDVQLQKMKDRIEQIISGSRKGKQASADEQGSSVDDKISRAKELRDEHPDWDKQAIIDQVNTEFSQEFADAVD